MERLSADLLLSLIDPGSGKPVVDATRLKAGLAGVALAGALLDGLLLVDSRGHLVRHAGPAVNGIWEEVLSRADGQKPKQAIARCGAGSDFKDRGGRLRDAAAAALAAQKTVEICDTTLLGIFPSRSYAVLDMAGRNALLDDLRAVLDGSSREPRAGTLVVVLGAIGALPKLLPERDKRWLAERVAALGEEVWAGPAVAAALRDLELALIGAVTAVVVVSGTSS